MLLYTIVTSHWYLHPCIFFVFNENVYYLFLLGTITCSSPTASPADGLIQNVANRRARSATWSYHFYPDEPCVELTIHLPFAVLLKYVHIRPHGAAISSEFNDLCFYRYFLKYFYKINNLLSLLIF